jgi:uncharacterized protein YciI
MFIVLLKFSDNKTQASMFMNDHIEWIKRGFDDGLFLLSGSIQPSSGGVVLVRNSSLSDLQRRLDDDPFVRENIVSAEILEIAPGHTDERLAFAFDVQQQ